MGSKHKEKYTGGSQGDTRFCRLFNTLDRIIEMQIQHYQDTEVLTHGKRGIIEAFTDCKKEVGECYKLFFFPPKQITKVSAQQFLAWMDAQEED